MKTLTVRLPEALVAQIESESRDRKVSKSDVVRERLSRSVQTNRQHSPSLEAIADLIGCIDGLPADLGSRKKHYLKVMGYGRKRHR
jgi:Arc/MetJ-type ribon-helix-helix transcriptional regulator